MKNLITICARAGSKGVIKKNIRELNGKALIAYTIEIAKKFQAEFNADIALSTDSEEIKSVAKEFGLESDYLRPEFLGGDKVGKLDVIEHLLSFEEERNSTTYQCILDLDVTSPLRTVEDLKEAFSRIQKDDSILNLFSVNEAKKNPYFNMVEDRGDGKCKLVKEGETFLSRQETPKVFDLNASFYFYRRTFFSEKNRKVINPNSSYYLMEHLCFDIDEEIDFSFMEYILKNKLLDFDI